MQLFSYAVTMPTFALIHIFTSPAATNNKEAIRPRYLAPLDLKAIIPSFSIGYFLLCFLFAYPFSSDVVRQWCGAFWQGFPHFVVLVQFLLIKLFSFSSPSSQQPEARSPRVDYQALLKVYSFAFNIAAATQLFTLAVLGGVKFFPGLFPDWATETLTFNNVFNPGPFYGFQPLKSMSSAMQTWFLYDQYTGSAAALIWGSYIYLGSRKTEVTWRDRAWLGWDISRWFVVAGAGGALVRLLQRRDEVLLLDGEADKGKKTS
jgi:hypothetical protein